MVDEESFLTDVLGPIHWVLDRHVIDIEQPANDEQHSCNMICPQLFINVLVEEPYDAGKHEWSDKHHIIGDPELVGKVVIIHDAPVFKHFFDVDISY